MKQTPGCVACIDISKKYMLESITHSLQCTSHADYIKQCYTVTTIEVFLSLSVKSDSLSCVLLYLHITSNKIIPLQISFGGTV